MLIDGRFLKTRKLKTYLKDNGIKQIQFATELGTTVANLSHYLNWRPFPQKYCTKAAKFLGLSDRKFLELLEEAE